MFPVVKCQKLVDGDHTRLWSSWDFASVPVGCWQTVGGPPQACGQMIK